MSATKEYKLLLNICVTDADHEYLETIYSEVKHFVGSYSKQSQTTGQIISILDPCKCGERKQPNVQENS
jgi:hypothetical protein